MNIVWKIVLLTTALTLKKCNCQDESSINRAPFFLPGHDMALFSLPENFQENVALYQLKALDPEGRKLYYSISGPIFIVDRESGVVKLRQKIDREQQSELEVVISVTDESVGDKEPNTVSLRRLIPIRDYNDNTPIFVGRPYSAKINETAVPGYLVHVTPEIIVYDRDEGINSEISLSCYTELSKENDNVCDYFDVSPRKNSDGNYSAEITLLKPLDFESRQSFVLSIHAKDGSRDIPLSANATVTISVLDLQDNPPIFMNEPYSVNVPENEKSNHKVLTIFASDGDIGNPNQVVFTLEKEKFGYFKLVKSGAGEAELITTDKMLDRENPEILENGGYYSFLVRATEILKNQSMGDSTVSPITVIILDMDDNKPLFNYPSFNLSVPENLEYDTALPGLSIIVNDNDMGVNSRYNLSIKNVRNADGVFMISPASGDGRTPIVVKVKDPKKLDYDVEEKDLRVFVFEIVATVHGIELSRAQITVNLQDANDNSPRFSQSSYKMQIEENSAKGVKIGDIYATDRDYGLFGKLKYYLRGFGAEYFSTNTTTGGVYVNKNLDYEKQKSYSLTMVAQDGGKLETNANLFIEIQDMNDNAPMFESMEYSRTIREGSTSFEPEFFIKAIDVDGPTQGNGLITYSIESENSISGHVFGINNETGEIKITNSGTGVQSSDTYDGNYELKIAAQDFGYPPLKNFTKVVIRVGLSENQRPIFKGNFASNVGSIPGPPIYRVEILENVGIGFNVTTVQASDPDGMDKLIRYRIMGDATDSFNIDEKSGRITVSPDANLERDNRDDSYTIVVNAIDGGLPFSETATATVKVKILDVNNKPPKFNKNSYTAYVPERSVGDEILAVTANDPDDNANIKYSIVEPVIAISKTGFHVKPDTFDYKDYFGIEENSGRIRLLKNLENNVLSSVMMTVKAQDLNAMDKQEQIATTEVTIYVQSYKETGPVFKEDGWKIDRKINLKVKEESPIGSVILQLRAEDPSTETKIYQFEMETGNEENDAGNYFTLKDDKIILIKRLDYEELSSTVLKFDVKAFYQDTSSVAHVTVNVQNINDNAPIFEKNIYKATALETTKYPEKLLVVHASDNDAVRSENDQQIGYSTIVYSLTGPNAALFIINSKNGEIQVAKNQKLDREKQSMVKLHVIAEDAPGKPSDSRRVTAEVWVEVLDYNDNAPMFLHKGIDGNLHAVIPESSLVDSLVMTLNATDIDEGPAAEVQYEFVSEGEALDLFTINAKTGEVKTKSPLTGRGRTEPYEIVVRATDGGSQIPKQHSLFTDQTVHIHIGDIYSNDGIPYFLTTEEEANIIENAPIGAKVFQIQASDPDDPTTLSGMLRYKIQDDIEDAKSFRIEALSGLITTAKVLDREVKNKYHIIIEVSDQGEPSQAATKVLKINVEDVDDNEPKFVREDNAKPFEMIVMEEQPAGVIVGNISAVDDDIGENGAIDYEIIDGNELDYFKLSRTDKNIAIITTTKSIDRESFDSFLITVKCFKNSSLRQRQKSSFRGTYDPDDLSELKVLIRVVDIDDHLPEFDRESPTIGIRNNIPINTLIYHLKATDEDASAQAVNYQLLNVSFTSQFHRKDYKFREESNLRPIFELNNQTGEIILGKSVSTFVDGYFQLTVRAMTSNKTNRFREIFVRVFVVRDKSIMKFVFAKTPMEITAFLPEFTAKLQKNINTTDVEVSIFDAQVLNKPDQSMDFSSTSACFQLFRNGNSLNIQEMKKIMNSEEMKNNLRETYLEYSVNEVDLCAFGKAFIDSSTLMSSSGTWIVLLAALIGVASLISTLAACCLSKRSKSGRQRILSPPEPEPIIYTEPIYSLM